MGMYSKRLSLIPYLATFSAIIVLSYNVILKRAGAGYLRSPAPVSVGRSDGRANGQRRLTREDVDLVVKNIDKALPDEIEKPDLDDEDSVKEYMRQRMLLVTQSTFPHCVEFHLTANRCKDYIDEEIMKWFSGADKLTRVIIRGKRSTTDSWYNAFVIVLDDNDLVLGRDGDGLVYYDFEWDGSGEAATPEQQAEIPPVLATETAAGSPLADKATTPQADPASDKYQPLILEPEPVLVEGATVDEVLAGDYSKPIAGGVVIDPYVYNMPAGEVWLEHLIREYKAKRTDGSVLLHEAGPRTLPAVDCNGMNGYCCCLAVKMMVPDSDKFGRAVQCQFIFTEQSNKFGYMMEGHGKKVIVYANHNEFVSQIPFVEGSWDGQDWAENVDDDEGLVGF